MVLPRVERPFAALVYSGASSQDAKRCLDAVEATFAALYPGDPIRRLDNDCVQGAWYGVRVTLESEGPHGPCIMLDMMTPRGLLADVADQQADYALGRVVLACLTHVPCDDLLWYDDSALIDAADFQRLRRHTAPPPPKPAIRPARPAIRTRREAPALQETATPENSDTGATQNPDPSPPLRAATWLMAGTAMLLSLPVGVIGLIIAWRRGLGLGLAMYMLAAAALLTLIARLISTPTLIAQAGF